jgi:transposase
MGLSKSTVQRVWAQARLKPHRLDNYMASDDPRFEQKAADIIGLNMNPPQHAAVFCVDEKTAIQALDWLDRCYRCRPVARNATASNTIALLNPLSVRGAGRENRQGSGDDGGAAHQPRLRGLSWKGWRSEQIHVVLDNLSARKTKDVDRFLREHPRVRFHFTPTYSSWLNQVELWFAKIQRDDIARGVFTLVADLGNKLRRYIGAYCKTAMPFQWTYTDPKRRIPANKIAGT